MPAPDFSQLEKVLLKQHPDRPVLFEFFLNTKLYELLSEKTFTYGDFSQEYEVVIPAFKKAGYDYATLRGSDYIFPSAGHKSKKSYSANDTSMITNREEFQKYEWPDPESFDYSRLERCKECLPDGMKIIVWGPGGVLENMIELVGYDNLCYMLVEDPDLIGYIADKVGSGLLRYYEICAEYDSVGALIGNDDWGFSGQTLLSPQDLRKYVIPWHKRIVEAIHKSNKPAILHSCGNLETVMEDIYNDIGYDGKHSYEDNILPVEQAYDLYHDKIAILGGMDMDFICRRSPDAVYDRSLKMIQHTAGCTGYALGSGNSIPDYVPTENFLAMLKAWEDSCQAN